MPALTRREDLSGLPPSEAQKTYGIACYDDIVAEGRTEFSPFEKRTRKRAF